MKVFFSQQKAQKAISGLLVIWLSGFVLLFCCGAAMEVRAETEFCPLSRAKSHCDKAKKAKADDAAVSLEQSENEKYDCCGFLPAVFDKARKIEKNLQTSKIVEKIKIEKPRFSPAVNIFESPGIYDAPVYSQKKIFIKHCVFRI